MGDTVELLHDFNLGVESSKGPRWKHLSVGESANYELAAKEFQDLDELVVSALLADETRPRLLESDNGLLLILRGVNFNKDSDPEDMVSLRLWIQEDRIISVQRRPLKAIEEMEQRIKAGKGPRSSGEFLGMLVGFLFDRMDPVFGELEDRLDTIEEQIIENPDTSNRQEISAIRKEAILYRRYIAPQRDVLTQLRSVSQNWLMPVNKRVIQEALDDVFRYVESLDTIRERASIVKDELSTALSDQMNKNLYMLSLIAAIFLPLGFLTGLLGINLGGIPGAENGYAFYYFCGILVAVLVVQVILFRKFKWF